MKYILLIGALTIATAASADDQQRQRGQRSSSRQSEPTPRAEALSRNVPGKLLLPAGSGRFDKSGKVVPADGSRHRRPGRPRPVYPSYGVGGFYGGYGDFYPEADYTQQAPEPPPPSVTWGVLRLDVTPMTGLLYYIDGEYFGSSADLGTQFEVTAGGRRVEVRAQGYKSLAFNTRITPGETASFRGALEPLQTQAAIARPAGNPTMFIIPGCYMGNARPNPAALRPGCDVQKMITR